MLLIAPSCMRTCIMALQEVRASRGGSIGILSVFIIGNYIFESITITSIGKTNITLIH